MFFEIIFVTIPLWELAYGALGMYDFAIDEGN